MAGMLELFSRRLGTPLLPVDLRALGAFILSLPTTASVLPEFYYGHEHMLVRRLA